MADEARPMTPYFKLFLIVLAFACMLYVYETHAAGFGPYTLQAPLVIDGDTIKADVSIWPEFSALVSIRIAGVDTPELHSSLACERDLAQKAKAFTESWVSSHVPLTITNVNPDKYAGRVDAVVTGKDGAILANDLIASGQGRPYNGGARPPWCQ